MKLGRYAGFLKYAGILLTFWTGIAIAAPPGAATLISPSGSIETSTPAYSWNSVASSTWYYLWVQDSSGVKIQQWYTSTQVGCSGGGTCSITPAAAVADGGANFWIQTWNADGYGPWSAASAFAVGGMPIAATLIAPTGTTMNTSPAYSWNAVANSSWYYLWVQDSGGVKVQQWYTAAQANCGGGTGTCSVMPASVLVPGAAQFWVQTWNAVGFGPWSAAGNFTVSAGDPDAVMCTAPDADVQAALLAAVNTFRSTPQVCRGVTIPARPPLAWNNALGTAAQGHSDDMAANDYFDHTGLNGSTFTSRATAAGYTGFATGENIAAGSLTVGATISQWENSTSGHCEYLMTENSNEMGAGCGNNPESTWTYYWTFQAGTSN